MQVNSTDTLGSIVTRDANAAKILQEYNLDFCCGGADTLGEACLADQIEVNEVIRSLEEMEKGLTETSLPDFREMEEDALADYIQKKHHAYVEEQLPLIRKNLDKLVSVHGSNHPELIKINQLFTETAGELAVHMKKEELMLFPYIKKMKREQSGFTESSIFGSVSNPIQQMMDEHDHEGDRFHQIAELTNRYTVPADGCNTYRLTYAMLREFEDDLHMHIHLENNILFPKAIALEKKRNADQLTTGK